MIYSKAQSVGQVIVFMLSLIVFLFILAFGYKYINLVMEKQDLISVIDFKHSFINEVKSLKPRFDSVETLNFNFPGTFSEVCVVDPEDSADLKINRPYYHALWSTGMENVFFYPKQAIPISVKDIKVDNGYCCFDVSRGVKLRFQSLGSNVKVSPESLGACKK